MVGIKDFDEILNQLKKVKSNVARDKTSEEHIAFFSGLIQHPSTGS